jgi:hypothetical protein
MAGFRFKKAVGEQAALKIAMYGPPGSGKTFTSLLMAEGLAKLTGKRIAFCDTEHGTDFYCQAVKTRGVHPAAFDFDAVYTQSITEVLEAVKSLDPKDYSVVVIDSITHIWQSAIAAYSGKQTKIGTIPMQAWGRIKKPYKDIMTALLSSPLHVIICGRQGIEYATDEESEELKAVGYKLKAEGETAYEPHILIRMEAQKPRKTNEIAQIVAYAEKDRTGVLAGRSFVNPTFDSLCAPLLGLLGATQAQISSGDETAALDAEALANLEIARLEDSAKLAKEFVAQINLTKTKEDLKLLGKEITPALKSRMTPEDLADLREQYALQEKELR